MEVHSILQIEMRKVAAGFQGVSEVKSRMKERSRSR